MPYSMRICASLYYAPLALNFSIAAKPLFVLLHGTNNVHQEPVPLSLACSMYLWRLLR